MNEELKRFEEELKNSKDLQEKFEEAVKHIAESGEAQSDGEIVVKAAAELGYTFTVGDLERAKAGDEKMDADELEQLSGGSNLCVFDETCYTAFLHPSEQDKNNACWSDYKCVFVYEHYN